MAESPLRKLIKDKSNEESIPESSPSLISKPDPFLLDFEMVNGNHVALPYTSLLSLWFNPSEQIVAMFATHTITIRGICLKPVYAALLAAGVSTLKAVGDRPRQHSTGVPLIYSIDVERRTGDNQEDLPL